MPICQLRENFCLRMVVLCTTRCCFKTWTARWSGCRKRYAQRERILIYGDYDVDGTASIVILKKAIEILGGICRFLHTRIDLTEGYGMKAEVIERAAETE